MLFWEGQSGMEGGRGAGGVVGNGREGVVVAVVVLLGEGEEGGSAKNTLGVGKMGRLDFVVVFVGIG